MQRLERAVHQGLDAAEVGVRAQLRERLRVRSAEVGILEEVVPEGPRELGEAGNEEAVEHRGARDGEGEPLARPVQAGALA